MSLALIAGTGALPFVLFQQLSKTSDAPLVCAMQGFEPELKPNITFRIENLGSFLQSLKTKGVTRICMAGAVKRPEIDPAEIDPTTMPLIPRLQTAMAKGDDGALRGIITLFEEEGFTVVGAAELLPELLPPTGVLTKAWPEEPQKTDAKLGDRVLTQMGAADSGQACLIKDGAVIAREGPDGTDAMIAPFMRPTRPEAESTLWPLDTAGDLLSGAADWLSGQDKDGTGAILFKAPKPGQDRRADLPVIGPQTAERAVAARFAGIVIEDGGVMVLDLPRVRQILDAGGLFLWVRQWD